MDVGSTTVKAVVVEDGKSLWRDYRRHNTKQAETVLEYLARMESECGFAPGRCEHEPDCGVRSPFAVINRTLVQTLERVTLADLVHHAEIIPLEELGLRGD